MKTIFMFSGQGSQYFHMGAELLEHHPGFARHFSRLSSAADAVLGRSLRDVVYAPIRRRSDEFSDPVSSNVALLTFECALVGTLEDEGIRPDLVCGMSLGEYSAAVVAGVLDFEAALRIVASTGACFSAHCRPGGMLAILGDIRDAAPLRDSAEVIFVSPGSHFVVAGSCAEMAAVERQAKRTETMFQSLPVAHGYHSSNIDPAHDAFEKIASAASFRPPRLPIYSSFEGRAVENLDASHLWNIARGPMHFVEIMQSLPRGETYRCIDLGPSGTMANLVRYHARRPGAQKSEIFPIVTPFANGHTNLRKLVEHAAPTRRASRRAGASSPSPVAYVFPGQGAQRRGMGSKLFARYPDLIAKADRALGYSVERLCIEDPDGKLGETQYTQPALFVVNALLYRERRKSGPPPSFVAGHSLGEYSALYAAGAVDFVTGLKLVEKRGALMARAQNGGMAAVLGLSEKRVRHVVEENGLRGVELANLNSPTQVVVSGPREAIVEAASHFEAAGCERYVQLNVSGAFHSRLMRSAASEFSEFVGAMRFGRPGIPVVANVSARPYEGAIAEGLVEQMTSPVRWTETIEYLETRGVREFVEVGPGTVLTGLIAACRGNRPSARSGRPQTVPDRTAVPAIVERKTSQRFSAPRQI